MVEESNSKDLEIAKLKLEAFELRQKVRDFQALQQRYLTLQHRYNAMQETEAQKQSDLRGLLEYQTTTAQSMIREIDELRAIKFEQNQRLQQSTQVATELCDSSEQLYLEIERMKFLYQQRSDQAASLKRELTQRVYDVDQSRSERDLKLQEKEAQLDKLAQVKTEAEDQKTLLAQKRKALEKGQIEKENLIKQYHDRKYDLRELEQVNQKLQKKLEDIKERKGEIGQKMELVNSALDAESDLVKRTDESLKNTREQNDELIKLIGDLKAKKEMLQDVCHKTQNGMDLTQVNVEKRERTERDLRDEILKLTLHSNVVKKQNETLFCELDEFTKDDEIVREKLQRGDVVEQLRQKNYDMLAYSQNKVERSRSPERQRHDAFERAKDIM